MHGPRPGRDFGRVVLASCLEQVDANCRPIQGGRGTEEHIHDLRVALRRMRTLLHDLPFLLPPFAPRVEAELKKAFDALGAHRDVFTLVPAFAARMYADGAPPFAWRMPDSLPLPAEVVAAPRFRDALRILALAAAERESGIAPGLMRKRIAHGLERLHRGAVRDAARFRELSPPQRHALRKRMKRLRYAMELTLPLFGGKAGRGFVEDLRKLQTALGAYQDALTARALWQSQAELAPEAWFGVGWLSAEEKLLEEDCARACGRFVKRSRPCWR